MVRAALPVLDSIEDDFICDERAAVRSPEQGFALKFLPLDKIRPNPSQPRRTFNDDDIRQLAESLKRYGPVQPILVRPVGDAYEVVAGERRLRAAQVAGFPGIAAIIRDICDEDVLETSLVENLHRATLNPIEKARAYRRLHEQNGLSHAEIGRRMGEDRRTVAHAVQLLDLGSDALALVESEALGSWHGKALLQVTDPAIQSELAKQAAEKAWSVRHLEGRIKASRAGWSARTKAPPEYPERAILERLTAAVGVPTAGHARRDRPQCGSIRLVYRNVEEKRRVFDWLKRSLDVVPDEMREDLSAKSSSGPFADH